MCKLPLKEICSFLDRFGWKVTATMYFGGVAWMEWQKNGRKVRWSKADGGEVYIRVGHS